jgi:hypothetical protein
MYSYMLVANAHDTDWHHPYTVSYLLKIVLQRSIRLTWFTLPLTGLASSKVAPRGAHQESEVCVCHFCSSLLQ